MPVLIILKAYIVIIDLELLYVWLFVKIDFSILCRLLLIWWKWTKIYWMDLQNLLTWWAYWIVLQNLLNSDWHILNCEIKFEYIFYFLSNVVLFICYFMCFKYESQYHHDQWMLYIYLYTLGYISNTTVNLVRVMFLKTV